VEHQVVANFLKENYRQVFVFLDVEANAEKEAELKKIYCVENGINTFPHNQAQRTPHHERRHKHRHHHHYRQPLQLCSCHPIELPTGLSLSPGPPGTSPRHENPSNRPEGWPVRRGRHGGADKKETIQQSTQGGWGGNVEMLGDPYYKRIPLSHILEYSDLSRDSQLAHVALGFACVEPNIHNGYPNEYHHGYAWPSTPLMQYHSQCT
jgi:hypothetical protein